MVRRVKINFSDSFPYINVNRLGTQRFLKSVREFELCNIESTLTESDLAEYCQYFTEIETIDFLLKYSISGISQLASLCRNPKCNKIKYHMGMESYIESEAGCMLLYDLDSITLIDFSNLKILLK